jgi:Fe2+ transport system protein FeoA
MAILQVVPGAPPPASSTDPLVPLSRLRVGQAAVVARVLGRTEDVHRLEEFGLRHGARIEVFRQGRPCILRLGGGKVCLRGDHSLKIFVVPLHAAR